MHADCTETAYVPWGLDALILGMTHPGNHVCFTSHLDGSMACLSAWVATAGAPRDVVGSKHTCHRQMCLNDLLKLKSKALHDDYGNKNRNIYNRICQIIPVK